MGKLRSPWKKGTTIAVALFVMAFIWFLIGEAKAETKIEFSAGATGVGGELYDSEMLMFTEMWDDEKYQLGLMLQLRLDCKEGSPCKRGESEKANQAVLLQRVVTNGDFQIGLGVSYWHNQSPAWNSNTPFFLSINYKYADWILGYKHFSTGGTSSSNGGLDMATIGYTF